MQNLPGPEVYEKEFKYMPWGVSVEEVLARALSAPEGAKVLDLMCGPGYLLGKIKEKRSDLQLLGVDMEPEFIEYAKEKYPGIQFEAADAFSWKTSELFDCVLVTAGVHHLSYDKQEAFLEKVSKLLKPEGTAIIADPYIDDYSSEEERKIAGTKLGYEYMVATIKNGASEDVVKATVDILSNDVLLVEYKTSIKKIQPLMEKYFSTVEMYKTWPKAETEYGDYYFVLKK